MSMLADVTVAILAADGFELSDYAVPKKALEAAGARVCVISLRAGNVRGWDENNWSEQIAVDSDLYSAAPAGYDAIFLPGGLLCANALRADMDAITFIREFYKTGKPIAAASHAAWLLAEADLIENMRVTCAESIATDIINAGALWVDGPVVVDDGLITSRSSNDTEEVCQKLCRALVEDRPQTSK